MFARFAALCPTLATLALVLVSLSPDASAQKVFTVAGGYVGDGKPATSAALSFPEFAAFNSQGELLITDAGNCRIRKVNRQGVISTIAGTGICGFRGDGGPAIQARISQPSGIALDSSGNIFFSDQFNERVRKIDTAGTITTIAGNGSAKYCGDGKLAVKACLSFPTQVAIGVAAKGEVLYIADASNQRIRQVVLNSGIITTVAGNGTIGYSGDGGPAKNASFNFPDGVSFYAPSHTLWISDGGNSAIRQVDLKTGIITTFFGDGTCPFTPLTLCNPFGLTTDTAGNLHVADFLTGQVLGISVPGQIVSLDAGVVGNGFNGDGIPAISALFVNPIDVALDPNGEVLTIDTGNNRVRKGHGSENIETIVGGYLGDGKLAKSAAFNGPDNLAFDKFGNLYVADSFNNRIRKLTPSGKISTFAGNGLSAYAGDGSPADKASLNFPSGVIADGHGNVFIADWANSVVRKVNRGGTISTFAQVGHANSMAIDSQGQLYVADSGECVIWKIAPNGDAIAIAGQVNRCGYSGDGGPAFLANLNRPFGLALDAKGDLFIGDSQNHRVRVIDAAGIINTIAGSGTCGFSGDGGPGTAAMLCRPRGVALGPQGNLYIADSSNYRVRVLNGAGTIETLAGSGNPSYNGDGLPALKTNIAPFSVAVSPAGMVYLIDDVNNRVRKIQ